MFPERVKPTVLEAGKHLLDFSGRTLVMGILNVTPDSFSDGGMYDDVDKAIEQGRRLVKEGADILDVGGESTRPGAEPVSEEEELERVIPVIEGLADEVDVPISIDTYKSRIAMTALDAGASIINDISGLRFDRRMAALAGRRDVPVVVMHIKGTPRDMQISPTYKDMLGEIYSYLEGSIGIAEENGVPVERVIIDPGIGFGKRLEDNFKLIKHLDFLKPLGCPVLVGPSRKSFLRKTLGLSSDEMVEATAAAVTAAILAGADIVRVHDVMEVRRAVVIADEIVGKV